MKRRSKVWKTVPQITPFERRNAAEVAQIIRQGHNPLTVTTHSAEGSYPFRPLDVMNYFESNNKPFNLVASLFTLRGDTNEKYNRCRAV
jgi:hypothetical protein